MRVCGLAVEFGEGEGPRVREEGVEVVDGIKNGDYVEEGRDATYEVLGEDGFGDVDAGIREFFGKVRYAVAVVMLA